MNTQPSQRNWFPVIVAGLTVLLAGAFYAKYTPSTDDNASTNTTTSTPATPVTEEGYKAAVENVMATYRTEKDAQAAYDAIIVLHVPGSMQTFHIDCIIAFGKLVSGDSEDGAARLDALHAQHPWFTL